MLFALVAKDKEGALDIRKANREDHLAYLKASGEGVAQAGPLLNEGGEMIGSLIILDMANVDAARAWAEGDPYGKAGLFASVEIIAWKKVI